MRIKSPDLLIHPVRLRIVQAFFGDRRLAAEDLTEILADVPKATLYRHIATLVDAGVLTVAAQQPARGTPRRIYVLAPRQARLTPAEMAQLGPEDQLHAFTVFVGTLLGDFARYAADGTPDPGAHGVSYGQFALNLTDQELRDLVSRLSAALAPALHNELTPERRRRTLTTILLPAVAGS